MSRALQLPAIIAASALAHAAVFVAVRGAPHAAPIAPSFVDIAITTPPSPPPPPPPTATPPSREPASRIAPRPSRSTTTPRAITRTATPPAPASTDPPPPADFTGTTLTNDSGEGWAAPTGNGEPMERPIAAPRPPVQAPPSDRTVVALADLSRPPRAPNLDAALVHNYPADARDQGIPGRAVVRARITADGTAHVLDVVSESQTGFGVACRRTVDASRWDPPLDRTGRAVATLVTYTCRFEVGS